MHRMSARLLAFFSAEELASIAAVALAELPHELAETEARMNAIRPLPTWATEGVLLSTDLNPRIFEHLALSTAAAAAATCSAWRGAWHSLLVKRRVLLPAAVATQMHGMPTQMAMLPNGQLCMCMREWGVGGDNFVGRLDVFSTAEGIHGAAVGPCMHSISHLSITAPNDIAVTTNLIYVSDTCRNSIIKLSCPIHSAAPFVETVRRLLEVRVGSIAILENTLCALTLGTNEVLRFDALTLEQGSSLLLPWTTPKLNLWRMHDATMVSYGGQLYFSFPFEDCVRVLSNTGEAIRTITGFKRPRGLSVFNDRIYLVASNAKDRLCRVSSQHNPTLHVLDLEGAPTQPPLTVNAYRDFSSLCATHERLYVVDYRNKMVHALAFAG